MTAALPVLPEHDLDVFKSAHRPVRGSWGPSAIAETLTESTKPQLAGNCVLSYRSDY